MKRFDKIKKFALKHGPLLALVLLVAGEVQPMSLWTLGQAEAPEELL